MDVIAAFAEESPPTNLANSSRVPNKMPIKSSITSIISHRKSVSMGGMKVAVVWFSYASCIREVSNYSQYPGRIELLGDYSYLNYYTQTNQVQTVHCKDPWQRLPTRSA